MEIRGCGALSEVLRDCRVVLLTATEAEAAPLRTGLRAVQRYEVATKPAYVGATGRTAGGSGGGRNIRGLHGAGHRVVLAISGCDKANAAHTLTCLLQAMTPAPVLVLQVGIAGAFPPVDGQQSARVGDLVVAASETYSDTGASSPGGWISAAELGLPIARLDGTEAGESFPLDPALVQAAVSVLRDLDWRGTGSESEPPAVLWGPCLTSSLVTGRSEDGERLARRWRALAESMEGAAAAHVCALYGVPFLEVRAISNMIGDRDRAAWALDHAIETAGRGGRALMMRLDDLLPGSRAAL